MTLDLLKTAMMGLQTIALRMSLDGWIEAERMRGEKIQLFRDYADGEHRSKLTDNMRKLLRIGSDKTMDEFTDNYMDLVIQTMVNRLEVSSIDADNSEATKWIQEFLDDNRFDGIQADVHEAALRDGVSYVMPEWDNEAQRVVLNHELAFDGISGVLVAYGEKGIDVAIKIWHITSSDGGIADTVRVNVYLKDEIRKYISQAGGQLTLYDDGGPSEWTMKDGSPIGIPIISFRNRTRNKNDEGKSEIENVIPLQDMLNRTLYSMVMAAENTAFQIRIAKGFNPPTDLTPGMWVIILDDDGNPPGNDVQMEASTMETGELVPFIEQAKFLTDEIARITSTPIPGSVWDNVSGESLKQRDVALLGKVKRFQTKAGNAWEDVASMAMRIQSAFGDKQPPPAKRLTTRWRHAEIRDDAAVIENALKIKDAVGDRAFLEIIAPVYGWDENKIQQIIREKEAGERAKLEQFAQNMPRFESQKSELVEEKE